MNLREALQATGIAEAYLQNCTASVRDEEGETGDKYLLSLANGAMPPYYAQEYDGPETIEAELAPMEPGPITWYSVEPD